MMISEMQEIMASQGFTDKIDPKFYQIAIEPAYSGSCLNKSDWVANWLDCGGLDAQKAWQERDKQTRKEILLKVLQNADIVSELTKDFSEKEMLLIKLQCGTLDPHGQQALAKLL